MKKAVDAGKDIAILAHLDNMAVRKGGGEEGERVGVRAGRGEGGRVGVRAGRGEQKGYARGKGEEG
jgi:hypothetical protein